MADDPARGIRFSFSSLSEQPLRQLPISPVQPLVISPAAPIVPVRAPAEPPEGPEKAFVNARLPCSEGEQRATICLIRVRVWRWGVRYGPRDLGVRIRAETRAIVIDVRLRKEGGCRG